MAREAILAIDQGTTSSRGIVFDTDGTIISTAQRECQPQRATWPATDVLRRLPCAPAKAALGQTAIGSGGPVALSERSGLSCVFSVCGLQSCNRMVC